MITPTTICIECKHHLPEPLGFWHWRTKFFCKKHILYNGRINPVTGEFKKITYAKCKTINSGDCQQFKSLKEI